MLIGLLYIGKFFKINFTLYFENIFSNIIRASKKNNQLLVDYLLQSGASLEIKNKDGKTAGEYTNDPKIALLLKSRYKFLIFLFIISFL